MKQTAVEWLYKEMIKKSVNDPSHNVLYILQQAKEMEKEQKIEFANSFYDECGMQYGGLEKSAEEYYNETYK